MATHSPQTILQEEMALLTERDLAMGVLELLLARDEWVHRRVERVEMVTAGHSRRSVSVDFTLPSQLGIISWFGESRLLVPLDLLKKSPLPDFDARDEEGRPIPVLSRRQNGALMASAFEMLVEGIVGTTLPEDVADLCHVVVKDGPPGSAQAAIGLTRWLQNACGPPRQALVDALGELASVLAHHFALIAMPLGDQGRRRVLKYSFEEVIRVRPAALDERTGVESILESLGLRSTTVEYQAYSFLECESFHFEVVAPNGVELISIVLGDEQPSDSSAPPLSSAEPPPRRDVGYERVLESNPHRAHLSISRSSDPDLQRFYEPRVSVQMRMNRKGWLRASAFVAVLVSAFFWFSLPFLDDLTRPAGVACVRDVSQSPDPSVAKVRLEAARPECELERRLSTDPAALAGALLGALSLLIVRPGEHPFAAQRVWPLRAAAVLTALSPLVAAWLLAFPGGAWVERAWWPLAMVDTVLAGLLVAACVLPLPGDSVTGDVDTLVNEHGDGA